MGLFGGINNFSGGNIERPVFSVSNLSVYFSEDLTFANLFYGDTNITELEGFKKEFSNIPEKILESFLDDLGIIITDCIKKYSSIEEENNKTNEELKNEIVKIPSLTEIEKIYGVEINKENPCEVADLIDKYLNDLESGKIQITNENSTNNKKDKKNNFSEDTVSFELFKNISGELSEKYKKYITIGL